MAQVVGLIDVARRCRGDFGGGLAGFTLTRLDDVNQAEGSQPLVEDQEIGSQIQFAGGADFGGVKDARFARDARLISAGRAGRRQRLPPWPLP